MGIDLAVAQNRIFDSRLTMIPKILFIGHSYHQVTKSSAFFVEQLELLGTVTTEVDDCLNGEVSSQYLAAAERYDIVVVWQLPQVIRQFAVAGHRKNIIFVPMYDAVHKLNAGFWQSLQHIKIVCFSSHLEAICLTHGLDSFFLKYYPEWVGDSPAGYSAKRLFFWQRRSWPNWQTVASILPPSQFERMHLHVAIDPEYEIPPGKTKGPTPLELDDGRLSSSVWFDNKSELLEKLREFNVFFLPRKREGIGLSFLDAMKMGMIPVGLDHATYNEYVVDGLNGFIVSEKMSYHLPDLQAPADASKHYFLKGRANYLRNLEGLGPFLLRPIKSPEQSRRSPLQMGPNFLRRCTNRLFATVAAERSQTRNAAPLISIIVTVRNDIEGFLKTHRSICEQSFTDFEYIVVDLHSVDGTRERIGRNRKTIDHVISGKDRSRSKGMRLVAKGAKGRYLLFFNAGDEFAETSSLAGVLQDAPADAEIIYGHHYGSRADGTVMLVLAKKLNKTLDPQESELATKGRRCRPPCEQAVLISRELFLNIPPPPAEHNSKQKKNLMEAHYQTARTYHSNTVIVRC